VTSSLSAVLAVVAAGLVLVAVGFQVALAAGAPWGAAAYGGRAARPDGTLPPAYRVGSAVTVAVLAAAGSVVLLRGGVVGDADPSDGRLTGALWVVAVLFGVNTVGNLAGRHPVERWGMSALTLALAILCGLLAAGV
jgi:hypothetical protein